MAALSPTEIAGLARTYFGDLGPQAVANVTAIALAESRGVPEAVSPANTNGTVDRGLMQVNSVHGYDADALLDPAQNMAAAREIFDQQGWGAWSTWNDGSARAFWEPAAQATTVLFSTPAQAGVQLASASTQGASQMAGTPQAQQALTGIDIVKLGAYLADLLAGRQQQQAGITGYDQSGLPTFAREQYGASRADADRQYQLDLQRFGLQYAQTMYQQRLGDAQIRLQQLALETDKQGPEDWLKYSYIMRNKVAPPSTAGGPIDPNIAGAPPTLTFGPGPDSEFPEYTAQQAAEFERGNPSWRNDMRRAKQMAAAYNQPPVAMGVQQQPAPQLTLGTAAGSSIGPGGANNATASGPGGGVIDLQFEPDAPAPTQENIAFDQQQDAANAGLTGEARDAYDAAFGPGGSWDVPQLAFGGRAAPVGGGMYAAVAGDAQHGNRENREMVVSRAPFTVVPENRMNPQMRQMSRQLPHRALGGEVTQQTPFVESLQFGGAPFQARGEDLGVFGKTPFNYGNYARALPSEQAMFRGYVNTPQSQGGLGGYFEDELARARNSSFMGASNYGGAGYGY